jgi:SOS-response transcriptional repressor LexA
MTNERSEREAELLTGSERSLAALVVAREALREDSVLYTDAKVVEAIAAREREKVERDQRNGDRTFDAWCESVGAGIEKRLRASLLKLECLHELPKLSALPSAGPASAVIPNAASDRVAPLLDLAVAAGAGRELWDAECEQGIPLPADVPRGAYVALRVAGDSMTPLMHSGDIVLVHLKSALTRGSVIVARVNDGGYVVKQVGRVGDRRVELISMNPVYPPISVRRVKDVVGQVVLCWCTHEPGRVT